jgi:uncharacterized protein (DUF2235 family)
MPDKKSKNRNLVVVLDGTSNQFGMHNSNCVEFYSHLEKTDDQLTYYNSGIGTYMKPTIFFGPAIWKETIRNCWDMAFAYRLKSYVMGAYRWLSDHYCEGDRIFLYGFSRGAYEVRVLAAMIHKVGLIYTGNEEQIPFAYALYADRGSDDLARSFKRCFSRHIDKIHFVGLWDTVSSVGLLPKLTLPRTEETSHILTIRHALSLDERRVKFMPELYPDEGGKAVPATEADEGQAAITSEGQLGLVAAQQADPTQAEGEAPKEQVASTESYAVPVDSVALKQVWMPGTHSDVGGGNQENPDLKLGDVPLLWMEWESLKAGVHLRPEANKVWDFNKLPLQRPTPSLTLFYWPME